MAGFSVDPIGPGLGEPVSIYDERHARWSWAALMTSRRRPPALCRVRVARPAAREIASATTCGLPTATDRGAHSTAISDGAQLPGTPALPFAGQRPYVDLRPPNRSTSRQAAALPLALRPWARGRGEGTARNLRQLRDVKACIAT